MIFKYLSPNAKQIWVSLAPLVSKIGGGLAQGYSSSFLIYSQSPDFPIKINLETMSWFVSSLLFAGVLGNNIAGYLIDKYGRRPAGLISNIPGMIGGIVIYFAQDATALIAGRILTGLALGANILLSTVVVAEYCSPQNRGTMFNIKTAFFNLGTIVTHILGHYIDWRTLALLTIFPYYICFLFVYTSPESPSWLAARHEDEKSRKAFYWLRGRSDDSTREIEELLLSQKDKNIACNIGQKLINLVLKFKQKNFLKPTFIVLFAFILTETSGRHIFPSYGSQVVKEIISEGFNNYMFIYKIGIDLLIFSACMLSSYLVRVINIRTLLFVSGLATFVVLMLACLALYLNSLGLISKDYALVTVFLFALFFFLANLGCSCIPFALVGELYPLEHRAVGTALGSNFIIISVSLTLKIFPAVLVACKIYGSFALLGLAMIISLVILYFSVPETKDRTLLEIEEYFNNGKFRDGVIVPTDDDNESFDSSSSCSELKHVC